MVLDMRTLDMRLLLNAIKKSEFKVAFPEDYLRKAQTTNLTSTADEGELEDKLIAFEKRLIAVIKRRRLRVVKSAPARVYDNSMYLYNSDN